MKKLFVIGIATALAGCNVGESESRIDHIESGERYAEVCIDNVVYLYNTGPSGRESMTVKFNANTNTPEKC